ncbi:MAG: PEGA domain-containing protein, partial [Bradymonadaceae bacterium]
MFGVAFRSLTRPVRVATIGLAAGVAVGAIPAPAVAGESGGEQEEAASGQADDEQKAKKVLKLIRQGKKAYDAGNYEKALNLYQKAYDLYPKPAILVRLGKTAEELGTLKKAISYYEKFIEMAPDKEIASKLKGRVEKLKKSLPGTLTVRTVPEGTAVRVGGPDGRLLGEGTVETEMKPGTYELHFAADGFESTSRTVEVTPEEKTSVSVELSEVKKASASGGGAPLLDFGSPLTLFGVGAGGAGVLGLGTGVVFSILQANTTSKVNSYDRSASGSSPSELRDLKQRARRQHRAALVSYSIG